MSTRVRLRTGPCMQDKLLQIFLICMQDLAKRETPELTHAVLAARSSARRRVPLAATHRQLRLPHQLDAASSSPPCRPDLPEARKCREQSTLQGKCTLLGRCGDVLSGVGWLTVGVLAARPGQPPLPLLRSCQTWQHQRCGSCTMVDQYHNYASCLTRAGTGSHLPRRLATPTPRVFPPTN